MDIASLPFELICHIASFLWADISSVRACSLTSRLFWNATMPMIYHNITLKGQPNLDRLRDFLTMDIQKAHWVRLLRIDGQRIRLVPWTARVPSLLLGVLPRLYTLELHGLTYADYFDQPFFLSLSAHSTVRELVVVDCRFNLNTLQAFICALPSLEILSIKLDRFHGKNTNLGTNGGPPLIHRPRLVSLSLLSGTSLWFISIYHWLGSAGSLQGLRSLILQTNTSGGLAGLELNMSIPAIGQSLQHLDLKGIAPQTIKENGFHHAAPMIDLKKSAGLTTLVFRDAVDPSVSFLLRQLPNPTILRSVTFVMGFGYDSIISLDRFKSLDRLLASDRYPGLREVLFIYEGPAHFLLVNHTLRRIFSGLLAKDTLYIKSS